MSKKTLIPKRPLSDAGIVSLNLVNTLKNQNLPNGNQLTREGSFTRADGSTAAMGEFQLATDTFDTKFAQEIEVPEALKTLPNMQGAGNVRELQQAAPLRRHSCTRRKTKRCGQALKNSLFSSCSGRFYV